MLNKLKTTAVACVVVVGVFELDPARSQDKKPASR
jgi:hypothetical protein